MSRALFSLLFILLLVFSTTPSPGGMTTFTERGKTDFDTTLHLLNPYGTWSKIDGLWAYTPLDHEAPYTNGRWIYTEYGWYWKGNLPHSWATEHYGYWKRSDADKIWSWYPGPFWLPETVEIRATATHIGWRSAAVDQDGNFVEKPEDRWARTDEWTFVTRDQFAGPITPAIIAKPDDARDELEDSTDSAHSYLTYREIDRPGPHPADFLKLGDGGMFAPMTLQDRLAAQPPPPSVIIPGVTSPSTNSPAAKMTGTTAPALIGSDIDPSADTRKVKYWITMSLPNFWASPPADAKGNEIYLYRPDFYQDQDGVERRVTLWFNPQARVSLKEALAGNTPDVNPDNEAPPMAAATAPTTERAPSGAFHSPLDDSYHPGTASNPATSSGTNAPATPAVPATDTPIPSPLKNGAGTKSP